MRPASASSAAHPYAPRDPSGPAGLPWYRAVVRVVLVVVPAQVVGALLATLLVVPVDLAAHPGVAELFWVVPGLVAGAGVGLVLRAGPALPWRRVGVAAAVGAASYFLLVLLGHVRAGIPTALLTPRLAAGLLGCVGIQTVVSAVLLLLRRRRTRG